MFTRNMTPEEIDREMQADMENVRLKMDHMKPEFRRRVLKAAKFPVKMRYEQHTKRGNRWLVELSALSKKNVGELTMFAICCVRETPMGKWVILPSLTRHNGVERWKPFIIKPHFFSRYREREKLQLTGEDLNMHLLGSISDVQTNFIDRPDGGVDVTSSIGTGFALGEAFYNKNVVLFKTYVPNRMLVDKQIVDFLHTEEIRQQKTLESEEYFRTGKRPFKVFDDDF